MAVRIATTVQTQLHAHTLTKEWAGLLASDTGDWILTSHYNDKCLHVFGVFGGATVSLQGSNEDAPANGASLTDPTQTLIALTALGIKQVLENPLFVRPVITGGDGTTNLTVRLVCR